MERVDRFSSFSHALSRMMEETERNLLYVPTPVSEVCAGASCMRAEQAGLMCGPAGHQRVATPHGRDFQSPPPASPPKTAQQSFFRKFDRCCAGPRTLRVARARDDDDDRRGAGERQHHRAASRSRACRAPAGQEQRWALSLHCIVPRVSREPACVDTAGGGLGVNGAEQQQVAYSVVRLCAPPARMCCRCDAVRSLQFDADDYSRLRRQMDDTATRLETMYKEV